MKLLIAVDSAISTEVLVSAVGTRPWPDGTTAHVLSIVADMDVPEEVWREVGYVKRAVHREMERRGEQITAVSVERLRKIGIPAEVVVARGDARFLIPFYARKWSSDLIFVRAHVRKNLEHWMLGSVSRAVVTSAPCTVQIVRDAKEDGPHTPDSPRRVLVATDGSETSTQAVRAVAARPWLETSEFRVISVEEPWAIASSSRVKRKEPQEAVSTAEQVLRSAGLNVTGEVLSGKPKDAILEQAQKWAADLIVVGSHGRRGFKRLLLGSVSEAVAMNAHCSVVVVRGPRKTET
jgi:nucleotide-binding universal stress UspA family protein